MRAKSRWIVVGAIGLTGAACGDGAFIAGATDTPTTTTSTTTSGAGGHTTSSAGGHGGATTSQGGAGGHGGSTGGEPQLSYKAQPIDFGPQECGGAAPKAIEVPFKNKGDAPLKLTASLSGAGQFYLLGDVALEVEPGASASIQVGATAVPQSATAGATVSGTLTVETNDPDHAKLQLPVTLTATGITLKVSPGTASFGVQPLNVPVTQQLTVSNDGNEDAQIDLGALADPAFDVSPATLSVPKHGQATLQAKFTPKSTSPTMVTASLGVKGATCGQSASSITLSGQGTSGTYGISTSDLYFGDGESGLAPCGSTPADQTFTINNTGAGFNFTTALGKGASSPFTVSPASGSIPGGQTKTFTVTSSAIPQTSSTAAELYSDTLTITVDQDVHVIKLHETAEGAIIAVDPASLDFGDQPVGTTASKPWSLTNSGNAIATITIASGDPAHFAVQANAIDVGAGVTAKTSAEFSPSAPGGALTSALTLSPGDTVLCQPLPTLPVSGNGTAGQVSLSPTSLDFGAVACGATGQAKTITLKNTGNGSYKITSLALGAGDALYTLTSNAPADGTVAPGTSVQITVTPKPIPKVSAVPGSYGDTLTITTDAAGDVPHVVPIVEQASGAILAIAPATVDFGNVAVNTSGSTNLQLTNTGNAPVTVSFKGVPAQSPFHLPQGTTVAPGAVTKAAQFAPLAAGTVNQTATIDVGAAVLCQPPPATLPLTGTGVMTGLTVSPTEVYFGQSGFVACGTQGGPQTITVTNAGATPFNWKASLASRQGLYTLSSESGALPANQSVTLTLTPAPIPPVSATTNDLYADTVLLTTDLPGDPGHLVHLHQTAWGAVLLPSTAYVDFGFGAPAAKLDAPLSVTNVGNRDTTIDVALTSAAFTKSGGGGPLGAGKTTTQTLSFVPAAVTQATGKFLVTFPTPAESCMGTGLEVDVAGQMATTALVVTPRILDFGNVGCGQAAPAQSLTITNTSPLEAPLQLTLGKQGAFTFQTSCGKKVPASGTCTVTVTPAKIPATPLLPLRALGSDIPSDVLTITGPDTVPHRVLLRQNVVGALVTFARDSIDFGATPPSTTLTQELAITNSGTADTTITFGAGAQGLALPPSVTIAAGATVNVPVQMNAPNALGTVVANPTVSATATCAPIQSPTGDIAKNGQLGLTGTVVADAGLRVSPAWVDFGQQTCGQPGVPQRTVTFTNSSGSPLQLDLSFEVGSSFTVDQQQVTLPGGGSGVVTLGANAVVPATLANLPHPMATDRLRDVLVVKAAGASYRIPIHETPRGSWLSFQRDKGSFPPSPAGTLLAIGGDQLLLNIGNLAVSPSVVSSVAATFPVLVPAGTAYVPVRGAALLHASFFPQQPNQTGKSTLSLLVGNATPLCSPLPNGVTLTSP